jgi:predicted histone-like DNA-binding protein
MKYKLQPRANPQDRTKVKHYAAPVLDGKITKSMLSKEIVELSSLSRGDVSNVIESLIDIFPKYLLMGKSIKLGEFGTLRLSFSSEGVEDPADFHVSMISGVRIIFTPSVELRQQLDQIHFERE